MRRNQGSIVFPAVLREVYAQTGSYSAKFILDPARSNQIDDIKVRMTNSDGLPMDFEFKRWGTKINLSFIIDERTPDGVSIIDITMSGKNVTEVRERFSCWVIK